MPRIREELDRFRGEYVRAYQEADRRWQVSWFVRGQGGPPTEIAQVQVSDGSGAVEEAWTGHQVAWTMARGHPGAFGRKVNAPYVWLGLCLAFLLPFLRPPLRLVHLDLAVLLSFGIGYALFNAAEIGWSATLAYPPLIYLLARAVALARGRRPSPPETWMSLDVLAFGIVFLIGFRIGLNVVASNVIDVGYAGVIGADRIAHGEAVYGGFPADVEHGDTYGPANYLAYLPFELALPWKGSWDDLPAAHGAALAFDLATTALLFVIGRRAGGARTGALIAYLWLAFPFSVLVLNSNANDALVGALVIAALLAIGRPAARGALVAAAGLVKFAPLALVPLLARGGAVRFAAAFALTAVIVTVPAVLGGGLGDLYDRTVGFQMGRDSPFSIWGYHDLPELVRQIVQWAAAAFALALGLSRRRRDLAATAALAAAVLIAVQLGVSHWFYLYLAWFVPALLVALFAPSEGQPGASRSTGSIDSAERPAPQRIRTPISQGSSSAES